jgi:hypothetical protein
MASIPILRTECDASYITPSGSSLLLPVNCAKSDSDIWQWKYFWTKTIGTAAPKTTNGRERSPAASFDVEGESDVGQTVVRGIFAYIATDPISVNFQLSAYSKFADEQEPTETSKDNVRIIAKLYDINGATIATYLDLTIQNSDPDAEYVGSAELPATVCPKVLWLGAAIQPTGSSPLPETRATIACF